MISHRSFLLVSTIHSWYLCFEFKNQIVVAACPIVMVFIFIWLMEIGIGFIFVGSLTCMELSQANLRVLDAHFEFVKSCTSFDLYRLSWALSF